MNTQTFIRPAAAATSRIWRNKHTALSGLLVLAAFSLPQLAFPLVNIWYPGHGDQVKQTLEVLQHWVDGIAIPYGLVMSGGPNPKSTNQNETIQPDSD